MIFVRKNARTKAKALGFDTVKEMKTILRQGYKTKKEWQTIISLGFENIKEYQYAQSLGAADKDSLYSMITRDISNIHKSFIKYENNLNSIVQEIQTMLNIKHIQNFSNQLKDIKSNFDSDNKILQNYKTDRILNRSFINVPSDIVKQQIEIAASIFSLQRKLDDRLPQVTERTKLIELLNQFTPDVPVALERIAKLTKLSVNKVETYIKEIIRFSPEVGKYLDLEQVFIKYTKADLEIDELLKQFQEWERKGKGNKI